MLSIGIDIGATWIKVGLVKNNKVLKYEKVATLSTLHSNLILSQVFGAIDSILDSLLSKERKAIVKIGVGVPSVVDTKKGIVHDCFNIPSWKNFPLKAKLEARYSIPVKINNDAKCFAYGESLIQSNKNKTCKSLIGITLGTGIGAGIIINGQIYEGNNCGAGEIGRIPFKDLTIEDYCSSKFFKKFEISAKEIEELSVGGDLSAIEIYSEFGKNLGVAIATIVHVYDPEIIVLGGSISNAKAFFEKEMLSSLQKNITPLLFAKLKIKYSKNKYSAIIGAVNL